MSLSPYQPIMVHDLQYLKKMSQLVEEHLSSKRFALMGSGECEDPEVTGPGKGLLGKTGRMGRVAEKKREQKKQGVGKAEGLAGEPI